MRKAYRRRQLLEPLGASDVIEPYRAAISKVPGVVKVRAVIRERRSLNERYEFTITLFSEFHEHEEMRRTVIDDINEILSEFLPATRIQWVKENAFIVVVQRQEKFRFR